MKVIKYRIPWYNGDGSFSGFTYWGRIDHKNEPSTECFTSPGQWGGRRAGIDEQFTGLHDDDEAEIYEGDILDGGADGACVVYWDEHSLSYCYSCDHASALPLFAVGKVIGNIHENPELLK